MQMVLGVWHERAPRSLPVGFPAVADAKRLASRRDALQFPLRQRTLKHSEIDSPITFEIDLSARS